MNYWKLLWLLVLWLILVAIPDSVSISYFFLFVILWSVTYLRYTNRKELKKKTGFLQTSLKILTFFFFFVLLLTSLIIPETKRNIPTKKIAPQEKTSELLPQEDSSITPSQAPEVQNLQFDKNTTRVQKQSTSSQKIYHTWKRGWCYYYNSHWKKEYVRHSFCK